MNESDIINLTLKSLFLMLALSLPPIIVASVVGVLVALFQALTQIQEQTLSFTIKLVTVTITLYFTANWAGTELYKFTNHILDMIDSLPRN